MRKLSVVALAIVSLGAFIAAEKPQQPELSGGAFRDVTDGQGTIRINSYGNTPPEDLSRSGFRISGVGHLAEFGNYLSIDNGRVEKTGDAGWSVVTPLDIQGGTATSSVQRGDILQVDFTHTVIDNGGGLVDWLVSAAFTNLTGGDLDVCYFPYVDYDLFETELKDTATYAGVNDDLGVPAVRAVKQGRSEVFVFVDSDAASAEWRIREWAPVPQDPLRSGQSCVTLENMMTPFGPGDMTAAYKFPMTLAAGDTVTINLQLGRFQ